MKKYLITFAIASILLLFCPFSVTAVTAKIEKTWVEENVVRDGEKGFLVHTKFSVNGFEGQDGDMFVRLCEDGMVVAELLISFTPGYGYTFYKDFQTFFPLNEKTKQLLAKDSSHEYGIVCCLCFENDLIKGEYVPVNVKSTASAIEEGSKD